jgi:Arc/MetJ-type ribon-helix-helix transcriptional regulator
MMLPMIQAKFSLEESQLRFLEQCKEYGFKDKSETVRAALEQLHQELERRRLQESAKLYAQVYDEDPEIRELTESAILDWPP